MAKKPVVKSKKPKVETQKPVVDSRQPDKETGPCCTAENVCRCSGE